MALRRPKASTPTTAPRTRDEMAASVLGPHHRALRATEHEPLLRARLEGYMARSNAEPIDLAGVPAYRHLAVIEDALDAADEEREHAGCDYCGSIKRRRTPGLGFLAGSEKPGHSTIKDRLACGACAEVLREHGEHPLRMRVFLAAAGCTRTGGLADPPGVKFAHEVDRIPDPDVPWSFIDRAEARERRWRGSRGSRSPRPSGPRRGVSMPGLPVYVWAHADLPPIKPTPHYTEVSGAAAAVKAESARNDARSRDASSA